MSEPAIRLPVAALSVQGGFRASARFATGGDPAQDEFTPPLDDAHHAPDPLAAAFAEGFAAGTAEARAEAEEQVRVADQARGKLGLSFAKLDLQMQEDLRLRLRDTVSALCEAAIVPLALDADALLRRIDAAVAMLARTDDERVIRLHPDDIAMICDRMKDDWLVMPDPVLERGALRVESVSGGVEDGPATWRAIIEDALRQC